MEGRGWQSHDRDGGSREGGVRGEGETQMDRDKGVCGAVRSLVGPLRSSLRPSPAFNSYLKTERDEMLERREFGNSSEIQREALCFCN